MKISKPLPSDFLFILNKNALSMLSVNLPLQEMLLALAQAVANATAALVLKAKNVASQSNDTGAQGKVITAAKDTARTTAQLVACVKVVVPSISSHMCQEQVVEAAKLVATAVDDTETACKVRNNTILIGL